MILRSRLSPPLPNVSSHEQELRGGLPATLAGTGELAYYDTIESGTLTEVFALNAIYGVKTKFNYQILISARLYQTFGFFLLGLWLGKIGLFRDLEGHQPFLRKVLQRSAIAWPISAVLVVATFATSPQPIDFSRWQHVIAINFLDWANLFLTLVIGSAFLLLCRRERWSRRLAAFAPYGRMALTNYVLQTLLGTALLFGWGLGLLGQISSGRLFVLGLALITLQAILSRHWLATFRYGPLEWLWRSATYFSFQPFRSKTTSAAAVSE